MRDMIVGIVLAVALLAGLFAAAHFYPHSPEAEMASDAAEVQSGFVGVKSLGTWLLTCPPGPSAATAKTPVPFSLNPNPRTAAAVVAAGTASLGRCRTTLTFRRKDNPKAIVLIVGFRSMGDNLAMFVRFPSALAKKGDTLGMRLTLGAKTQGALKLPVNDCGKQGCLAFGVLVKEGQDRVLASSQAILIFPVVQNGKPVGMLIPFNGLKQSVAAIRRAES
jgi:hypothetical protein